ncbi:MAG TPA: hypothetical protein VE990_05175 [Acidimicrobiales bacterium]|nr:hypothetical protein [Acidimicrobiales bacterium]
MSAADIGAAVGGGVGLVVAVTLIWAVLSLRRAVGALGASVEAVRTQSLPLLTQMKGIAERTEGEMVRMDALLERAASISETVDSASHLAYLAFSNPVIKALAFGAGTSRAIGRLRRRAQER